MVLLIPLGAPRVLKNPIHLEVQVHHFRLAQVHEAQGAEEVQEAQDVQGVQGALGAEEAHEVQEVQEVQEASEVQKVGIVFDVYIAFCLVREELSTSV